MSYEKGFSKSNKKKKKQENLPVESAVLETLSKAFILPLPKPSNKFPKARFLCKICTYHLDDVDRALKHSNDSLHQKNLKKMCMKNLLTYLPSPTKVQFEAINDCLEKKLGEKIFISKEECERRVSICTKMNQLITEDNLGHKLIICGSLLTGLSLANVSDVNLFLSTELLKKKDMSYLSELGKFHTLFKNKLQMKTEIKLEKNHCGLFCKDKSGVSYHISASNENQHFTSELIRLYLQIDNRALNLAKIFRHFAHKSFIDRVADGLFPSTVFPILVIYYLQHLMRPILPNLHKLAYLNVDIPEQSVTHVSTNDNQCKYVNDIELVRKLWVPPENDATLAELWIGLLRFYVVDFNSSQYIVSIRSTQPVLKSDRHMVNKRLAVEDPFDTKRNILFGWNSTDVIDFLHDQLQGCYTYFIIPQLETGPLFNKVCFTEICMANLKPNVNVTPIFTKDDFVDSLQMLDLEFKKLYTEEKAFYDVTKWPMELFIKSTLSKVLKVIFNSPIDINNLISPLELKIKTGVFLDIENYVKFKDCAMKLSRNVLQEFSDYFENSNSWSQSEMENVKAFELIKRSCQRFVNESLNIIDKELDEDDDDELLEPYLNEFEDVTADTEREMVIEEGVDIDLVENNEDNNTNREEQLKNFVQNIESWKLPIVFKQIYVSIKGVAKSSENPDEYNEKLVNELEKQDFRYDFNKISIHNNKLIISCLLCNTKGHRKENCPYAIPRFEELTDILKSIHPTWMNKLQYVLSEKYNTIIPNNERVKQNEKIFEKISEVIKTLFPTARPQIFGSTLNGFSTKSSDLDISLEFYEDEKLLDLNNKDMTDRLKVVGREIKKMSTVNRVEYILRARVPIVKFYMKSNLQGDISINNSLGIVNTKMLKLYVDICNVVKRLGNLIKYVAKICKIGDAAQGTLSSYAYMIMLIHFLQKRKILPVLQELYEGERPVNMVCGWDAWYQSDLSIIYKLWKDKKDAKIEFLWLDFLYYYAVEFDIDKEVVSIKQTKPLYKIDKNWHSSYFAIEDPFNLSHNLSGNLSLENCRYILECFAHVLKLHSDSEHLKRPDAAHSMIFEPSILQPECSNSRICFNCNKAGHIARDCSAISTRQTPTKNTVNQSGLPKLPPTLQFKPADAINHVYLQSEFNDDSGTIRMNTLNVPLKAFNSDINQFSIVPISMKFGDQTIIMPIIVGKDEIVEKKLNMLLKNGSTNNMSVFPTELIRKPNEPPTYHEFPNHNPQRQFTKMSPSPQNNHQMMQQQQHHHQAQFTSNRVAQQISQQYFFEMANRMRPNVPNNMPQPHYSEYYNHQYNHQQGMPPVNYQQQQYFTRSAVPVSMNNNNTPRGKKK